MKLPIAHYIDFNNMASRALGVKMSLITAISFKVLCTKKKKKFMK